MVQEVQYTRCQNTEYSENAMQKGLTPFKYLSIDSSRRWLFSPSLHPLCKYTARSPAHNIPADSAPLSVPDRSGYCHMPPDKVCY